jgi:hypothetical protein
MPGGFSLLLYLDADIKVNKCRIVWLEAVLRIRIQWGPWIRIRIRIQKGKMTTKIEKITKFHFLSAGCSVLRAEGFSCSLNVFITA